MIHRLLKYEKAEMTARTFCNIKPVEVSAAKVDADHMLPSYDIIESKRGFLRKRDLQYDTMGVLYRDFEDLWRKR